jgi:hypothetical protein
MPFIYDETEIEWPEDDDDYEPSPPRADQFVYIPTPQWRRGNPEPIHFSVGPAAPGPESGEPPQPIHNAPSTPGTLPQRSFWDILLGRWRRSSPPHRPQVSYEEKQRQRERQDEQRRQQLFAIAVPELQKTTVRRAYCRYDGGNDEGFSWPESFEMQDGARLSPRELAGQLKGGELLERLYAAKAMFSIGRVRLERGAVIELDTFTDEEKAAAVLGRLCHEWACMLLGSSFGTGEYSMYGAFTVDLEACTITDDPDADPVVENIKIAT